MSVESRTKVQQPLVEKGKEDEEEAGQFKASKWNKELPASNRTHWGCGSPPLEKDVLDGPVPIQVASLARQQLEAHQRDCRRESYICIYSGTRISRKGG